MSERQSGRPGGGDATINIRVKALDDSETIVNISTQETVQTLVDRGRSQLNISSGSQRIIFQGRVLDPTHTIQSAGILNGHAVHLVNRTPGGRNDSPNTVFERMRIFPALPIDPEQFFRRAIRAHHPDRDSEGNVAITLLPPIRVPAAVSTTPVLASHFNRDIVNVWTQSRRPRRYTPFINRELDNAPFNADPHSINWTFRVIDTQFSRNAVPEIVTEAINSLSFISSDVKRQIVGTWGNNARSYTIEFPRIDSHIPSPALEKLDFLCFWTDFLLDFVAIVEEPEGLVSIVREVLEMTRNNQVDDGLTTRESERRMTKLDGVIRNLEILSNGLSHMKDYERDRFKKHNTEEYRARKIEYHAESNNNPPFFMRHALDIDMTEALRKFRAVRDKISALETLMDDLMEAGALKFARDQQSDTRDYRYQAISVFFHYMQRARHQLAHATHLTSELNVCFLTPSSLQRLLPQYATNTLLLPFGHPVTITLQFIAASSTDDPYSVPITQVFEPPRRFSDVGDRVNGDWPYLPFNPPSVHMEAAVSPQRRMVDPRVRMGRSDRTTVIPAPTQGSIDVNDRTAFLAAIDPNTGLTVNDMLQHQQQELEMFIGRIPGIDGSRIRVQARPVRRVVTTGDAPSVPVETLPPPMEVRVVNRLNVHPNARGVETATLSGLPVHMEPSEMQRIARNIASRYRADALRRIARALAERFRQENWDTRIDTMPLCTLRECVSVALEMLTSAGANVNESKDLMLALVRDEEVFIRAIAECFKSLFGRGEFPTHVARIIMPRTEAASARNDYEDVDNSLEGADELEAMMVRMPSDVSQPASGDLRAIRNQRDSRRARREAAASASSPTLGASTSSPGPSTSSASATNPPGPSFSQEDMNEIRAGRLPGQSRRRVREAVFPQPSGPPQMLPNRPESPNNFSITFHSHSHYFVPMPPGQGPSTSSAGSQTSQRTQAGVSDSTASSNSASITSSPASPDPTRRTSAPPTVASSPTRAAADSEDTVEEVPRSSEAVRAARAHIDMLAANFTGQLPLFRPPNPPTEDVMFRQRPVEMPVTNSRPMIAIDPFMVCNHQQCEINRLQTPDAQPDSHRLNLQSLQPDPELTNHLTIQNLRPTLQRRGQRTEATDEDYNYEITRTSAGELLFEQTDSFNKFMRTAVRSLLAHCIDADTLLTMNMNHISGYVAANHTELSNMVRRSIQHPPYSRFNHTDEPYDEARMQQIRARNHEFTRELLAQAAEEQQRSAQERALQGERPQGIYRISPLNAIASSVDGDISFLPAYIRNPSNPRPPGFFGLVYDMMRGRFDSREVILLTRRNNQILGRNLESMRDQLISTVLDGNRERLSNAEMHRIAESIANEESFFQQFLDNHPALPRTFNLDDNPEDPVPLAWMFRQIEITVIKALITLALYALRNPTTESHVAGVVSAYLARNLMVFWLIADRDSTQQIAYALQLSTFVASIRFQGERPPEYTLFVQSWDRLITYWYNNYNAYPDCTEALFFDYIRASRAGTDWNDVQVDPNAMPSSAAATSSTSNTQPTAAAGALNPVNPRPLYAIWTQIWRLFQENAIWRRLMAWVRPR